MTAQTEGFDYPFYCGSLSTALRALLDAQDEPSRLFAAGVAGIQLAQFDEEIAKEAQRQAQAMAEEQS